MVPSKMTREYREELCLRIQQYVADELGQEIGQLAAENMLDFMLGELGPHLYNQAVADARHVAAQRMAGLEEDLYALERPIKFTRG